MVRRVDKIISVGLNNKYYKKERSISKEEYLEAWYTKYNKVKRKKLDTLFDLQDGKCIFCSKEMWRFKDSHLKLPKHSRATLEHVTCKIYGGNDSLSNLHASCAQCNSQRGIISFKKFMWYKKFGYDEDQIKILKEKKDRKQALKMEKRKRRGEIMVFYLSLLLMHLERTNEVDIQLAA